MWFVWIKKGRYTRVMMLLPDLGRLALRHAHEEEAVPTGVLDSAIGKASHKKRRWLAKWKQDEAARPRLEGLPLELRQLVTDKLVAKHAGNGVALCKALEAWCKAHPIACTHPALWEAAFVGAFGPLDPNSMDPEMFVDAFGVPVADPLPYGAMFVTTCKALGDLHPSETRVYGRMASWTDAQIDYYCFLMPRDGTGTPAQDQIYAMLQLRGASGMRRFEHMELARAVLHRALDVDHVGALLRRPGIDVDYVLPVIPFLPVGLPGSLLLRLVRTNNNLNPNGIAIVRLLLEHGADPNGVDVHGHRMTYGALHWAIRHAGNVWPEGLEQVKLLLAAGADPTVFGRSNDGLGSATPRELAVYLAQRPGRLRPQQANALLYVLDDAIAAREAAAAAAPAAV